MVLAREGADLGEIWPELIDSAGGLEGDAGEDWGAMGKSGMIRRGVGREGWVALE